MARCHVLLLALQEAATSAADALGLGATANVRGAHKAAQAALQLLQQNIRAARQLQSTAAPGRYISGRCLQNAPGGIALKTAANYI